MRDVPSGDRYTKDYFRAVGRAWERLLSATPIDGIGVRNVVLESWLRCRKEGVDPLCKSAPVAATGDDLERLYRDNALLYEAIQASIGPAVSHLSGTRMVLIAADAHGTLLTANGDPSLADQMVANRIVPGASWGERDGGTNAIGTALALRRPVQIHSQEHYCEAGKPWSCNAALIHDPFDRKVVGVVDVTGPNNMLVTHAGPFLATLVHQIEAHMRARQGSEHAWLIETFGDHVRSGEAAILCDAQGRVIAATPEACGRLASAGESVALRAGAQIGGLCGDAVACRDFRDLPQWLNPEWVTPLRNGDRCAGALLRIPGRLRAARLSETAQLSPALRAIADASPSLIPMLRQAERFARQKVPVLLEGETGTGKEVVARAIHAVGPTAAGPFVALNCAALPREILAAELFGHVEGAFTGARRGGAKGKLELANGGSLLLDEVSDMPLDLQPYLLRVLEEKAVWRLGDGRRRPVDVRIIAAANRPLAQEVASGRFRADLYHRLNVAGLVLPPLRERRADIPRLTGLLLRQHAETTGPSARISAEVMRAFLRYAWPGNIRELRNALERMLLLATDGILRVEHLPATLRIGSGREVVAPHAAPPTLKSAEQRLIVAALRRESGNCSRAARALGISRATLYRRLAAYSADILSETRST